MDLHIENNDLETIRTRRLVLRPLEMGDAPAIKAALNLWDVTQWLTNVPFPYALSDAEAFIPAVTAPGADPHWAIDAGDGLIGLISVRSELGYWLNYDYHGQGLMSEASEAVVAHHFAANDADLTSSYHLGNAASARVLTKLGFTNTHIETKTQVATDEQVDLQRMVLTKDRWMNR